MNRSDVWCGQKTIPARRKNRIGQHPRSCPVLGKRTKINFKDLSRQKITFGNTPPRICHFFLLLLALVKQHCLVRVSNGRMMEANCSEFSFRSWIQLKFGRFENKTRVLAVNTTKAYFGISIFSDFRMLQQFRLLNRRRIPVKVKMYKKTEGWCRDWTFYQMAKCNCNVVPHCKIAIAMWYHTVNQKKYR